ncbi:hypothetical protein [Actinomadura rugatobispora]|uniref:Uncharacterized protein n=1 Tax=Actinomadura rugatobispora TaxID=1994 RepID=A0ABW1AJL4_9ACTN|nr:hypothetical protein GCM10010200_046380 [Actinomadura rugatobispora]
MTDHAFAPDADETAHRNRIIDGLLDLAAFLEANPALPVPRFNWTLSIPSGVSVNRTTDLRQRAEIDRIAELLGVPVWDETADGGHYITRRHFGPVTYEAVHIPARRMAQHRAADSYHSNITASFEGEAA